MTTQSQPTLQNMDAPKAPIAAETPPTRRLVILTEIIAPYRIPVFNALAQHAGISLHVIFLAESDASQRQWLIYKDEIQFSFEVLPSWRRRLGKYNCLLNWGVGRALRGASPDLIVCGGYNYLASWSCLWWARRNRVPILLWVESTELDRRNGHAVVETLKKKFMRECDGFVVPGRSSAEYVRSYEGSRPVFTAPNAVDSELFAGRAAAARRDADINRERLGLPSRFFLFVGRLIPEKGVFDLLQAYGQLSAEVRSEWGLVFVGDGPARAELERRASAIEPGAVKIAGFVQRDELASYYGLAEMFIFPTHTDPWGLVVNEALACGLPVISTDVAGCTADLVEDGWNGLVLPPGDISALAKAIDVMARNFELREQMARNSLKRVLEYSPAKWAEGMVQAANLRRRGHND